VRATSVYDLNYEALPAPRKRLLDTHRELGSWHKVSRELKVNVSQVWNYGVNGKLPRDPVACKKLLGRKTINEHMAGDLIQDMPIPLLRWAFENRTEMR